VSSPSSHHIFSNVCGLIFELSSIRKFPQDPLVVLEVFETTWISNILSSSFLHLTQPPTKHFSQHAWKLRFDDSDFKIWKHQQVSSILFFDGASSGNQGAASAGGFIIGSDGKNILEFSWGLGQTSSNNVEALAFYMGMCLALERNITRLVAIGDSELIVKGL
jgi:hypothetical protein